MAEAPAHMTIGTASAESVPAGTNHEQPAGTTRSNPGGSDPGAGRRPARVSHAGVLAIMALVLLIGANVIPRPDWASHAQIRSRPPGFADVVDQVKSAVISVRVKIDAARNRESIPGSQPSASSHRLGRYDPPGSRTSPRGHRFLTGQGSGFFISSDGYAVTNVHVVEKAEIVEVTLDDGRVYSARVVGTDGRSDIALLKVDGAGSVPCVTFADESPRIGEWVIAVGNPFGLGGTVTAGIVSARDRDIGAGPYDDFLQIDAAVNRGNSGGPAFDMDGNVVGVNTAIVSPTGGSVGIAFAVPAATVKAVVGQLRESGRVTRGWIGVQLQEVTAEVAQSLGLNAMRGALVAEPQSGSPAANAGIAPGDLIIAINGTPARDVREVARIISDLRPGSVATIVVVRSGGEKTLDITVGSLPDQREPPGSPDLPRQKGSAVSRVGFSVAPASGGGVVVTNVDPDGPAATQGLASGDVILQADGRKIAGAGDLRASIESAQKAGKHAILMRIRSSDSIKYVAVPFSRG